MDLDWYKKQARKNRAEHEKFLKKLKKKPPKDLDYLTQEMHEEVFSEIDCLSCANCCKTTGPLLIKQDIERISKFLKIKQIDFEKKYLRIDEDQDFVFQSLPCPFLFPDNTCMIYEVRPKACREYPHTDRKKIYQINSITLKNIEICPAAFQWVEKMKSRIK